MKHIKLVVVLVLFLLAASLSLASGGRVYAGEPSGNLQCYYAEDPTSEGCDLALTKLVSVNSGSFVNAASSSSAVQAQVGDTITWQVTITNTSDENLIPFGTVTVQDILPSGLSAISSSASTGTYTDGNWTFILGDNLPATLTITSTASTAGLIENTASLSGYSCFSEIDPPYVDANAANNSASAFVNVSAVPTPVAVVAATPATPVVQTVAAPNTGFGVNTTNPLPELVAYVLGAVGVAALVYALRRQTLKK